MDGWATPTRWVFANGSGARSPRVIHDGQLRMSSVWVPVRRSRLAAAHRDRGVMAPERQGRAPGIAGKLAPHMTFPTEIVRAEPDITLKELAGALEATHGVSVQPSSIHRALIRAGFS